MGRSVFASKTFVVFLIGIAGACDGGGGGSSGSEPAGKGCPPYVGSVQQGDPGSVCDSAGDCKAPTCFCNDGTTGTGPRTCAASRCDGDVSCKTFCSTHGEVAPCGSVDGGK